MGLDLVPTGGGHTLRWSNAGHIPPTLIHHDGRIEVLPDRNPLLGVIQDVARTDHTRHLPPGTTVLLYTDGLVETRTHAIDVGFDRLHQRLTRHPGLDPDQLVDLLVADTGTHDDDIALLAVRTNHQPER